MRGLALFTLAAILSPLGCSTPASVVTTDAAVDTGRPCKAYEVPASTDLTMPAVSFRNDVTPILNESCGFATCHGTPHASRIYLGSNSGTVAIDPSAVRAGIVDVKTSALPTMPYVTSGDTNKSFLLHKIDGDICTLESQCTDLDCGSTMPEGKALLDIAKRDTIRRWIAQGALDN